MTESWSLANVDQAPINHAQFIQLTQQLKDVCFGKIGASKTDITMMNRTKLESSLDLGTEDFITKTNADNTTFVAHDIADVTEKIWHDARFIEVKIRTTYNENRVCVQFGGTRPECASFSLWGGDPQALIAVKEEMIKLNACMIVGDGISETNTTAPQKRFETLRDQWDFKKPS